MVRRFTTRPVTVEATEWLGTEESMAEIQAWAGTRTVDGHELPIFTWMGEYLRQDDNVGFSASVFDKLHNTWIAVKTGQFIVKGAKGEFYPCDDETFHWKYEEVFERVRPPRPKTFPCERSPRHADYLTPGESCEHCGYEYD